MNIMHWYVVDNFGNTIAGPLAMKDMAESFAAGHSGFSVVYKS